MKYEVHWISGSQDKTHGVFDTLEAAQDSVRDWWKKNNYKPPYIRVIYGDDYVWWDYGLHDAFYIFKEIQENKNNGHQENK